MVVSVSSNSLGDDFTERGSLMDGINVASVVDQRDILQKNLLIKKTRFLSRASICLNAKKEKRTQKFAHLVERVESI